MTRARLVAARNKVRVSVDRLDTSGLARFQIDLKSEVLFLK